MKNKIFNYDFLIVGAGLIGMLTALKLIKKKYKVLIVDKNDQSYQDKRTLAVNANSKDFLSHLGLWEKLKTSPETIDQIKISDYSQDTPLIFENHDEPMGNVILNNDLYLAAKKILTIKKILHYKVNLPLSQLNQDQIIQINNQQFRFKKFILCLGKSFDNIEMIKKYSYQTKHKSYVGFFHHTHNHLQTAYEVFTPNGPLAILPAPHRSCLLYTSPSPRDKRQSRMPSSA